MAQRSVMQIKINCISGNLLDIITTDFLNSRKKTVALNGQVSSWNSIEAAVPQGSKLGLLLFLMLSDDLITNFKLLVDDTSLFLQFKN